MAEEIKKEVKPDGAKAFWVVFKMLLGLAFLALGALALYQWRGELLIVVRGCIGLFLILAGMITLAIAKE
ncbi:MAG: hypothetical protein PHR11_01235 [Candidatus Omnitrophica bacterium]|nr:hypothetical protein [Candidatus Omnitrophota bacterium]